MKQWHQQGEALLTIENLRSWINTAGLVLFAPRPQIVSPAPTLAEAVLGEPNPSPTIEQTSEARSLLARLISEGLAVPLNLLGTSGSSPSDTPDFVASTAVFSYIFTLRGDKAWKQPPTTSGAFKVSPLALATHEALTRRGPLSAYDLATELGKEVTETAVLRSLCELWTHLRVLPLAQIGDEATLWELSGTRFGKQIKAGANAGQPSALSALISLYLGQAVVASEDEIESFLSPLASRSRIRDVIHALLSARQLETVAVEGRTMLHVSGTLPTFLAPESAIVDGEAQTVVDGEGAPETDATGEDAPRITKFIAKPRKIGTGYLAKAKPSPFGERHFPASKPGFKSGFGGGFKPRTGAGPAPDRERRPFKKPTSGGFDKPWEEEKARRMAAISRPSQVPESAGDIAASGENTGQFQPREPRAYTPRTEGSGERRGFSGKPAYGSKPSFGGKPSFGSKPGFGRKPSFGDKSRFGGKPSFGDKPRFGDKPAFSSDSRPPRRDFAPRADFAPRSEGGDSRPQRKTFSKPGTFGRKREGFSARPAFGSDRRPPRRDFSDRESGPRSDRGERPAYGNSRSSGSYAPRPQGDRPGGDFASRKPYGSRPSGGSGFGSKPSFGGKPSFSKSGSYSSDRPAGRPYAGKPREGNDRSFSTDSGKRVYRKFDAPRDRPARPYSSDRPARPEGSGGFAGKPSGDFAPRKFAGNPGGFAGKKPFGSSSRSDKPGGFGKSGGFSKSSGPSKSGYAGKRPSGKPGGGFGGKKTFGKSDAFTSNPTSTFAKFAGHNKPFGNRPPARKYKPKED